MDMKLETSCCRGVCQKIFVFCETFALGFVFVVVVFTMQLLHIYWIYWMYVLFPFMLFFKNEFACWKLA